MKSGILSDMALERLKNRARALKRDTIALWYAVTDGRTPWYAKALGLAVVAYALSPIDLIPDFIPVLGLLDDLLLVPAGIALVVRLLPPGVLDECRERAAREGDGGARGAGRVAGVIVAALWLAVLLLIVRAVLR